MRIRLYDLISKSFIGEEYYIEDVNNPKSFAYTYKNHSNSDAAPVFETALTVKTELNSDSNTELLFSRATDTYIIHDYKIRIKDENSKTVFSTTVLSDYYLAEADEYMRCDITEANLEKGKKYTAEIVAVNAYHKSSVTAVASFTY